MRHAAATYLAPPRGAFRPGRSTARTWSLGWFGACGLAIANGALRQAYTRRLGERRAHQVSTVTLVAAFAVYMRWLQRRAPLASDHDALTAGMSWMAMTLVFEFGFGHWVAGESWSELLAAYDVRKGEAWIAIPLWTGVGPLVVRHLSGDGTRGSP